MADEITPKINLFFAIIILSALASLILTGCANPNNASGLEKAEENKTCASISAAEKSECQTGMINDPAPGLCWRYIDEDSNNVCDLSE